LNSKYSDTAQGIEAKLSSLFKGNQFLLFVYKVYKDVRFVGAAPETVGNFGGDTDNWEWPSIREIFRCLEFMLQKTANLQTIIPPINRSNQSIFYLSR
jgi:hypothetical protein